MPGPTLLDRIDAQISHHRDELAKLTVAREVVEKLLHGQARQEQKPPLVTLRRTRPNGPVRRRNSVARNYREAILNLFVVGAPPMTGSEVAAALGQADNAEARHNIGTALWSMRKTGMISAMPTESGSKDKWRYHAVPQAQESSLP